MRSCAQSSQRSTWLPPSAAVRQVLDRRHATFSCAEAHMALALALAPRRPHGRERRRRPLQSCDPGAAPMRPRSGGRRSAREVDAQPFQRASLTSPDRVDGDAGVERGRLQLGVAEQHLDHADVDVLLEQMGGEAVAQRVRERPAWRSRPPAPRHGRRAPAGGPTSELTGVLAREQPGPEAEPRATSRATVRAVAARAST